MTDDSKPFTARQRRDALSMEKLFKEIDEEEVDKLTPEEVDAELRGLGIDPAHFTPAKVLARVRFRMKLHPELARVAELSPDWVMGGEPKPVAERVKRWLAIEEEIDQERMADYARLTPAQVIERARAAGFPLEYLDPDALIAYARRRARSPLEGISAPAKKSIPSAPDLRLVKPVAVDGKGRGGDGD